MATAEKNKANTDDSGSGLRKRPEAPALETPLRVKAPAVPPPVPAPRSQRPAATEATVDLSSLIPSNLQAAPSLAPPDLSAALAGPSAFPEEWIRATKKKPAGESSRLGFWIAGGAALLAAGVYLGVTFFQPATPVAMESSAEVTLEPNNVAEVIAPVAAPAAVLSAPMPPVQVTPAPPVDEDLGLAPGTVIATDRVQTPPATTRASARETRRLDSTKQPVAVAAPRPEASVEEEPSAPPAVVDPNLPDSPSREATVDALGAVRTAVAQCAAGRGGVANVRVTVRSSGKVTNAVVSGDFAGTPEGSCIARAVRGATFAPFAQPSFVVTYPYQF